MFRSFYGLRDKPFDIIPNPGVLYESNKHRQALTYLQYGFTENIGFILFTGEIGTGKTTLLKYLLTQIASDVEVAVVFNTNVDAQELLRLILIELEVSGVSQDKSHNLDLLNQHLIDIFRQGRRCLLIIDEAQNLSHEALEEVRLLSNLQTETTPLLQIILAGQPELRDIISSPGLEQLAQRVAINYHLAPLSRKELGEYIEYRLQRAGAGSEPIFEAGAVDLLHEHTGGVPRAVNILCNAALVYGYADSLPTISREVIEQVVLDNIGITHHPKDSSRAAGTDKSQTAQHAVDEHMLGRVAHLESMVSKLTAQVNIQAGHIDGGIAAGNEKLVNSLTDLLDKERVRSERYFGRCIALFHKNKMLGKELEKHQRLGKTERLKTDEQTGSKQGLLNSLISFFTG
ncbi:ExeA family protein [Pseudodesulfovibrio piezophilus]|uniref:Secretion ATPase, PEP-CTERM locus subfamily n=1 Tax=Pseudodesulfovibrio piezophilus (strain DSM 21447 / JCM 15486 / C1TLV30) TaxID=1322246 RepID=M1WY41_PSEP2|nr:AAA family ATPase [Pseudodesulfovibrio piezophilus]CCH50108.1 Secretion ATPase, PEP-CTERM locus subfamily [Pseudodesulfovibrio piezophilus C1TLV30]